ncbi:MAG: DegV family protein [Roseburia sp.]|nr:DegV family protein [Roseburia sp.]
MKWNIITDSSCDLLPTENLSENIQISSIPFIINVGNRDFVDDETLDTESLINAMEECEEVSHTSCPAPDAWVRQFEKAEQNIALTISSQLSGSMNSAMLAKEIVLEEYPNKKIAVLDSCSAGPELVLCVEELKKLIEKGADFDSVISHAQIFFQKTKITFALSSFNNLIKNGRIGKVGGFIAQKLSMWGIGIGSEEGTISMKGKARGASKALSMLLNDMRDRGFHGGKVAISHCHNLKFAELLKDRIMEIWKNAEVIIMPTRGLCSFYAERGGLIVSY